MNDYAYAANNHKLLTGFLMKSRVKDHILKNMKVIVITFEVFWIIVFLFANDTNNASTEMPQFIYVNF